MKRHGGQILADQLKIQGAEMGFGVPGESYLALLEGLYHTGFQFITCRMEAGAANMAVAYGKRTGNVGLCFVTRGPGATHASIGVHTARQDSVPMILCIGQVGREMRDREAFQEVDYKQFFGCMAKWVAEIDDAKRIPEYIARAYAVALSGRPGPVVLSLPEDMLTDEAEVQDAQKVKIAHPAPRQNEMTEALMRLESAKRPMIVVGGAWSERASELLRLFVEKNHLPVAAGFRSQDVLDNDSPCYIGDLGLGPNPNLKERLLNSDLILALGTRLEENVSGGYSYFSIPQPQIPIIHIHPDISELGRVYQPEIAINATMETAMDALLHCTFDANPHWKEVCTSARAEYLTWQTPPAPSAGFDMGAAMRTIRETTKNPIYCNGAGNYAIWVHRFLRYGLKSQLAPTSGAMGFGVPAAVAAALIEKGQNNREIISFNGDGCFLMCGQELATAVQYGCKFICIVVNNGLYGTIKMHQARDYPRHGIGTTLKNPDFVKLAEGYGCLGLRVTKTEEFPDALEKARKHQGVALIEIITDPNQITPAQTLTALEG